MGIAGVLNQYTSYNTSYNSIKKNTDSFKESLVEQSSKQVDIQEEGDVIGIAMIKEPNINQFWGMKAKFALNSTEENPVINVETNYGGKSVAFNISINDIDSQNASQLEIFALSSYADEVGIGDKSKFGTYQTLKNFQEMSIHNGYFDGDSQTNSTWEQFVNNKINWESACQKVKNLLFECNDIGQFKKATYISELLSKYSKK